MVLHLCLRLVENFLELLYQQDSLWQRDTAQDNQYSECVTTFSMYKERSKHHQGRLEIFFPLAMAGYDAFTVLFLL